MGGRLGRDGGTLTMAEVAKHTSKDDAWLVLFGEAIDVTKFIPLHPGGEDLMLAYLGRDATEDWQQLHEPDTLEKYAQFLGNKGKIKADSGLLSWIWKKMSKSDGTIPEVHAPANDGPTEEPETPAREPVRWSAEYEAELPPGGAFDTTELARWDGVQLPMCIGICGLVLDVSSSSNFTPDFGYGKLWAGRDTTWAMATVSLKPHDANRFEWHMFDLEEDNLKALAGWYKHFTSKYRTVGTLREMQDWDFSLVHEMAEQMPATNFASA